MTFNYNRPCEVCGHSAWHGLRNDSGPGWPKCILSCSACPDGKCILPQKEERSEVADEDVDKQLAAHRRGQLTRAIREASTVRQEGYAELKRDLEEGMKALDEVWEHACTAAWQDFDNFTAADAKRSKAEKRMKVADPDNHV